MDGLETFLEVYGLVAIFGIMLAKATGVPIPIPGDVIMLAAAARAAEGKLSVWQAFLTILVAVVVGGSIQFALVRGFGRGVLYRFGRYLGLTPTRLDAAAVRVERSGPFGISVAVFTPGVRTATVVACGLAGLPLRVFLPGLILGETAFVAVHFLVGLAGGAFLATVASAVPIPWLVALVVCLAAGFGLWFVIRRRQRPAASNGEVMGESFGAWKEATCPICLALGARERIGQSVGSPREHA